MANIFEYQGIKPVIKETAFVHPNATVIGDVIIGDDVYIGPNATLRGDWGRILIDEKCNVQESCVIHMFPGVTVHLKKQAHIGHGAIIHGAIIEENCLIGMNAVIMDNVIVGRESIVGALTFIKEGMQIPQRSLVVGNPAKIIKEVSDEMINWKTKGTELYSQLPNNLYLTLKECEPLREVEINRPKILLDYDTWQKTK
jgi:carbonic anhydrase/acetyltransferase-like protein (isoleucine patch superfamily)